MSQTIYPRRRFAAAADNPDKGGKHKHMKSMKKALALILVLAMLSGMVITVSAANDDVTVALYKEDGTALGSSGSVEIGDKVTVKMFVNTSASAFSASFRIWYDPAVFTYTSGAYTSAVTAVFTSDARINAANTVNNATAEEQEKLNSGLRPVNLVLAAGSSDKTTPTGEWVSMVFTAQAAGAAQFQPQIRAFDSETAGGNAAAGWTGSGASVTVAAPPVAVTGITLDQTALTLTAGGETATLIATVEPDNATDKNVTWTSSDPAVATVSDGVVTPVAQGTATITASAGDVSAECAVTVTAPAPVAVTGISLDQSSLSLVVGGEPATLIATVEPEEAAGEPIAWTSSDSAVATVSDGIVTPVAAGTTTITASAGGFTATCSITVVSNEQRTYSVSMPADTTVDVRTTVDIPVTVSSEAEQNYNAVDISFSYDPAHLSLSSTSIDGFTLNNDRDSGTIRIYRYGDNKAVGQAFILQFTVLAAGETAVNCTAAHVDKSANAPSDDAEEASITDPNTVINGRIYYTVSLQEGLSSQQGTTVEGGSDYTFSIDGFSPYYNYTVTATMGGESATVTDKGNGSYTIENLSGDVDVTFSKEGVQNTVTITGDDVTGGDTATYDTPYVFTVTEEEGYTYEKTVTIGGEEYTGFTGPDADGNYTIPGEALTGPVTVTVTKTPIQDPTVYTVTFEGSGADDVPDKPTGGTKGESLTFTVNEETGYKYTVTYAVDGGNDVTLTGSSGTYTIPGTATTDVNSYIRINIAKVQTFTITFEVGDSTVKYKNGNKWTKVPESMTVEAGSSLLLQIKQFNVYSYTVTATINGVPSVLTSDTAPNLNTSSTSAEYSISDIESDMTISVSWEVNPDMFNLMIKKFVEVDGMTVYFIGVAPLAEYRLFVDTYDGVDMFSANKYSDLFAETFESYQPGVDRAFLVISSDPLTREDVIAKLSYNNKNQGPLNPNVYDVNGSGITDINDAQLVYDIYKGLYGNFDIVSMLKFFKADVNCDASVNTDDAAAVVSAIA